MEGRSCPIHHRCPAPLWASTNGSANTGTRWRGHEALAHHRHTSQGRETIQAGSANGGRCPIRKAGTLGLPRVSGDVSERREAQGIDTVAGTGWLARSNRAAYLGEG